MPIPREPADYYAQLGVARDAPPATIRAAYKRLLIRTHPDRATSPADRRRREQHAKELGEAMGVLGDPRARQRYDSRLRQWEQHTRPAPAAHPTASSGAADGGVHGRDTAAQPNGADAYTGRGRQAHTGRRGSGHDDGTGGHDDGTGGHDDGTGRADTDTATADTDAADHSPNRRRRPTAQSWVMLVGAAAGLANIALRALGGTQWLADSWVGGPARLLAALAGHQGPLLAYPSLAEPSTLAVAAAAAMLIGAATFRAAARRAGSPGRGLAWGSSLAAAACLAELMALTLAAVVVAVLALLVLLAALGTAPRR
jgi:curved DNA-binding protein CbpA